MHIPNVCISAVLFFTFLSLGEIGAQDPHRFDDALSEFKVQDSDVQLDDIIVFTGSSSVRFWQTLETTYPEHNIINRGFGGSEMSDLLYFVDPLINQYKPKKVFIYEGDNDINSLEKREDILKEAKELVDKILATSPKTKIYFISAKPSVARWALQQEYEQFNYALSLWSLLKTNVTFIDVWSPMLDEEGIVMKDIFIGDNLHMNQKGYDIWAKAIKPYVED